MGAHDLVLVAQGGDGRHDAPRVERVTDVLSEGQIVKVKLTGIDERGRLSLSIKDVDGE